MSMAMGVERSSICTFLKGAPPRLCSTSSWALDCEGWKSGPVHLPTCTGSRINAPARMFSFGLAKEDRGFRRIVCEAQEIVTQAAEITYSTWQQLVLESDILVLVDFSAPWCGPCRMIAPLIDELARQYAGKMKCFKVNTDENTEIASKYGIQSIPTVMFFLNGQKMDTVVGAEPKTTLTTTIEKLMVPQKREG